MKVRDLVPGSWSGQPLTLGSLYSAADVTKAVKTTRVVPKTVTIVSNGQIIGKRTIYSK